MGKIFKSFEELADAMCKGDGRLHSANCAQNRDVDPCIAWQSGVMAFAEWLDHIGVKVHIDDRAESFYSFCSKEQN